jgi:hypothetical protein
MQKWYQLYIRGVPFFDLGPLSQARENISHGKNEKAKGNVNVKKSTAHRSILPDERLQKPKSKKKPTPNQ